MHITYYQNRLEMTFKMVIQLWKSVEKWGHKSIFKRSDFVKMLQFSKKHIEISASERLC